MKWRELKNLLLSSAATGTVPVDRLSSAVEGLRGCLRMAERLTKSAERLEVLAATATVRDLAGSA